MCGNRLLPPSRFSIRVSASTWDGSNDQQQNVTAPIDQTSDRPQVQMLDGRIVSGRFARVRPRSAERGIPDTPELAG
jgi:hypothetical protein